MAADATGAIKEAGSEVGGVHRLIYCGCVHV